jgi:hypothetical protein
MALFQSPGRVPLITVMSSNHARYGIMASPPSFRISPVILSGPTNLFFQNVATLYLINLISVVKGSPELRHCICAMLRLPLNTEEK